VYQQQIQSARQWNAMQQALTHEALGECEQPLRGDSNFDSGAISTAGDQKAILDLQARISAELGMLQNEPPSSKFSTKPRRHRMSSVRQQARERVIDGQGRFEGRFQPTP
jgi:type IV secretion system protein VirB5